MPTYRGSCHCGAVAYEVDGQIEGLEVCNCSLCARLGYVHWYVPPDRFRLLTPEEAFGTYQFGTFTSRNHFCRSCGIMAFRRARSDPNLVDVNVRCLEGVEIEELETSAFDGRHWEEAMRSRSRDGAD